MPDCDRDSLTANKVEGAQEALQHNLGRGLFSIPVSWQANILFSPAALDHFFGSFLTGVKDAAGAARHAWSITGPDRWNWTPHFRGISGKFPSAAVWHGWRLSSFHLRGLLSKAGAACMRAMGLVAERVHKLEEELLRHIFQMK
jgi:hypothetical protein